MCRESTPPDSWGLFSTERFQGGLADVDPSRASEEPDQKVEIVGCKVARQPAEGSPVETAAHYWKRRSKHSSRQTADSGNSPRRRRASCESPCLGTSIAA